MERDDWNAEYARIMVDRGILEQESAEYFADEADDAYNDGETPEDAVDLELACWDAE